MFSIARVALGTIWMQPLLVLGSCLKAAAWAAQEVRVVEHQATSKLKMIYVWDGTGCVPCRKTLFRPSLQAAG